MRKRCPQARMAKAEMPFTARKVESDMVESGAASATSRRKAMAVAPPRMRKRSQAKS